MWTHDRDAVHGPAGATGTVKEIVGEISPDEVYQQECLDVMRRFWKTKLEDRYAALG